LKKYFINKEIINSINIQDDNSFNKNIKKIKHQSKNFVYYCSLIYTTIFIKETLMDLNKEIKESISRNNITFDNIIENFDMLSNRVSIALVYISINHTLHPIKKFFKK